MHKDIEFHRHCPEEIRNMATFLAQLEKEQVEYQVANHMDKYVVHITGH